MACAVDLFLEKYLSNLNIMSPPLKQLKIPKTSVGFTKGNVVGGNLMKEMVKKSSNLSTQEWKNFNCFFVSIIRVYAAIIASTSFLEMQLIYVFFSFRWKVIRYRLQKYDPISS